VNVKEHISDSNQISVDIVIQIMLILHIGSIVNVVLIIKQGIMYNQTDCIFILLTKQLLTK